MKKQFRDGITLFANQSNYLLSVMISFSTLAVCGCGQTKAVTGQGATINVGFGDKVAFNAPKDWLLQKHVVEKDAETFQFLIPDSSTHGTPDSANAGLIIQPAQVGVTITNFSESRLGNPSDPHGYLVLTNIFAGGKWSTAATRGQQGETPYFIMDRFGVDRGLMIMFRLAHPINSNNFAALGCSISNFNAVVSSLKIGGTNTVNSEVRADHGTLWLRAFSDMDTNWMMESPTNEIVYRSPSPRPKSLTK